VLMTVNIALRRQLWQLDYFTEGSIPDALIGVPQSWTPDQLNEPSEENEQALAGLTAKISQELAPFVHGGSLDAERFDYNYVRDYRRYTSVATGVFMAAAGISRDDYLAIADAYASALSTFSPNETRDPVYSHLAKQDVDDNLRGYDLYEAGRIRQSR
jgi:hypothetical protein